MQKMNINWSIYTEEQIHLILCLFYQSLEYHIKNLHEADRSHEKGADIVVEKDGENIALAVKLKPTKADRDQVIDLANRSEKKKVYIYINTPTDSFNDFVKEYGNKIEFWDAKKLNDVFREKHPYFMANIIFDNSDIHFELEKLKFLLFYLREICVKLKKSPMKKLDRESFSKLWRLKDTAVALHKTNEAIFPMLRTPLNFKDEKFNEHFIEIFMDYMERQYQDFNLFTKHFLEFYEDNKSLVHNGIIRGITTSHWFWIGGFKIMGDIDSLKASLKKALEDQETIEKLKKDFPNEERDKHLEKELEIEARGNDVWKSMEYQVTKLELFGNALEIIIDDIMGEYLDYDIHLFSLENQDFSRLIDKEEDKQTSKNKKEVKQ